MDILPVSLDLPPMVRVAVMLFLLLFTPYLAQRLRIPAVVGYILAGALAGPHGLGVIPRHAEVGDFLAEFGKLLLMFFVGLEVNLAQFKVSSTRALAFGLTTFSLPLAAGILIGFAFGYGPIAAVLIGSLLASHTLIGYPIVLHARLNSRPAVTITVGATILTDMLSLLVLAVCVSTFKTGFDPETLLVQIAEVVGFILFMVVGLGRCGRWLFERLSRSDEACFTLMLIIVSAGAALAEAIDLEGILGAFLAGLAVNEAVRDTPAKEKLEFMGNAIFIPAFFIVTGFLIDLPLFVDTILTHAPLVLAIVLGLIGAKWAAAELVGRRWGFSSTDRGLMASLTMPQVAATLAAAMVGYQAMNAAGERLLDTPMLNTVLVLVLVTSVVGPLLTERFVRAAGSTWRRPRLHRSVLGRSMPAPAAEDPQPT